MVLFLLTCTDGMGKSVGKHMIILICFDLSFEFCVTVDYELI